MIKRYKSKKTPLNDNDDVFFSFKVLKNKDMEKKKKNIHDRKEMANFYHQRVPKRLDKKPRHGLRIIVGGLLLLVLASAVFYYYGRTLFGVGVLFTGNNVKLNIEGLTESPAGEEITYVIKYQNLEKIDLTNVVLNVNYPPGFVYKKAKPLPTGRNNNSWDLGFLVAGKRGGIEIIGSLVGEEDQIEKFNARLIYNLGANKSEGIKESEIETKISSSVLNLDITGPRQLLGTEVKYLVKYSNNSLTDVENVKIVVTYPEGFIFNESDPLDPQKNTSNKVWLINKLSAKESEELEIIGSFEIDSTDESADDDKIFGVQIGLLDSEDVFHVQQQEEFITTISKGEIVVNTEVNSLADSVIVSLGDVITYAVNYTNQSDLTLKDVELKLIINSNILDWLSLEDENDGVISDEEIINGMLARSITWKVSKILPGKDGSFQIKVKTKFFDQLDKTKSLDLKAEARTQTIIREIDGEKVDKLIESNKVIAQVNTELDLDTQVTSLDNGEYEITWLLTNTIHEVKQVKIEASLTDESSWLSDTAVTAGDIFFNSSEQKISWQLNRIPVGVDIPLEAKLKLKTDTTNRPKLLMDLRLEAIDNVTGAKIIKNLVDIMGK